MFGAAAFCPVRYTSCLEWLLVSNTCEPVSFASAIGACNHDNDTVCGHDFHGDQFRSRFKNAFCVYRLRWRTFYTTVPSNVNSFGIDSCGDSLWPLRKKIFSGFPTKEPFTRYGTKSNPACVHPVNCCDLRLWNCVIVPT